MVKAEQIMDALGFIEDKYVVEAALSADSAVPRHTRWIAAVLVLLLGIAFFTQTTSGAVAAAFLREQVIGWIETLFPPKEITVTPEGMPETEIFTAGGQEPQPEDSVVCPGFVLYYDAERYERVEENGVTYIRSIPVVPKREEIRANNAALLAGLDAEAAEKKIEELLAQQEALQASLPKCELEILHVSGTAPEDAAAAVKQEKQQRGVSVSETEIYEPLVCLTFHVTAGTAWDSPVEDMYFVTDGQTGTYQLTVRYFVEAAEGHGVRLTAILDTFHVLPEQDAKPVN